MATVHPSRMGFISEEMRGSTRVGGPSVPWRSQDATTRHDYPRYGPNDGGRDFMDSRRLQREKAVVNVWPPSPKEPSRELPSKRNKSSKYSKRQRSPDSTSSSSDSEEERRRRERKERKKARKRPSSSRHPTRSRSRSPKRMDLDTGTGRLPANLSIQSREISSPPPSSRADESGDDEMGPVPMQAPRGTKRVDERAYGGSLLRGEGSAMAAFLQDGTDLRIPRRGEIGLTSDQIAAYEDVGYVMSGSRHRRMNAVRMRKENQVISAEEKRSILKLQKEERERREAILREEFSELVSEKLKATGGVPPTAEK